MGARTASLSGAGAYWTERDKPPAGSPRDPLSQSQSHDERRLLSLDGGVASPLPSSSPGSGHSTPSRLSSAVPPRPSSAGGDQIGGAGGAGSTPLPRPATDGAVLIAGE